jgi:predicted transposase YdaD
MSYREILTMFGIQTSIEETRAYKDLVAIGHEKGLEEGREEGRQEEAVALLLRQARRRFGPLAPELEVRLDALPLARLEGLADAIFDLDSQSDLRDWMGRP